MISRTMTAARPTAVLLAATFAAMTAIGWWTSSSDELGGWLANSLVPYFAAAWLAARLAGRPLGVAARVVAAVLVGAAGEQLGRSLGADVPWGAGDVLNAPWLTFAAIMAAVWAPWWSIRNDRADACAAAAIGTLAALLAVPSLHEDHDAVAAAIAATIAIGALTLQRAALLRHPIAASAVAIVAVALALAIYGVPNSLFDGGRAPIG